MSTKFPLKGSPKRTTQMAQQGRIVGGKLWGWRYTFLRFSVCKRGKAVVHLKVSEPNWPFPTEVALKAKEFGYLASVPGERSPRFDALPHLMEALNGSPEAA